MRGYIVFTLFILLVNGVFAGTDAVKQVSVMEGDSVSLNSSVTKQKDEIMLWYFNDTRIALINGEANKSCLYYGEDGRFRDRLEVDYETGSLTITNITTEHAGRYEAELKRRKSSGTSTSLNRTRTCDRSAINTRQISSAHDDTIHTFSFSVTVAYPDKTNKASQTAPNERKTDIIADTAAQMAQIEPKTGMIPVPDSGLSSGAVAGVVAGIAVAVLLVCVAAAVGVKMYLRRRSSRKDVEKKNPELLLKV